MSPQDRQGWRKSSYSSGNGNDSCVEVAFRPVLVGVRDSKNPPGPRLTFSAANWRAFVGRL